MIDQANCKIQIQSVSNFQDLVTTPFQGAINALCWSRELKSDFTEIIDQVELSDDGQLARELLLNDFKLLEDHGALPTLNIIKC